MKIKKYCVKTDELDYLVKTILPKLFPEFTSIELQGNSIRFSKYKRGTFKRFLSSFYDNDYLIDIHLFELLVYHIPRRLSYYKAGNYTFAPQYTSFIFSIVLSEPKYLIPYIIKEYREIRSPFTEQTTDEFFELLYANENLRTMNSNMEGFIENLMHDLSPRADFVFHIAKTKL